jgi:4-hydroxybenzoate polyprenyltransferase
MLNKLKSYLEAIHITPMNWLVGISAVLMVRFFLESLSSPTSTGFFSSDSSTLLHYYLFFMCVFVIHMIIFQFAMPKWKSVIPQLIAITSLFVFIAPIADWIISGGKGIKMTYFFVGAGATIGMYIEIALMLLFFGILVHFAEKSWKRTIIAVIAFVLPVLFFGSLPGVISVIGQVGALFPKIPIVFFQNSVLNSITISNNLHGSLQYSSALRLFEIAFNFIMGKVLFLILVVLSSFWFYKNFKTKFKALVGDFRSTRTIHYLLMIFLGMFSLFIMFPSVRLNWNDWLSVIMLCLACYFSIRFAICVNDIVDEDIDEVSNTDRPLVAKILSKEDMKQASIIFVIATFISGFLAGYTAFFFIMTFTALYYIYSAPITRFKLIPFFSSFIISLCSLTLVMAGFYLISPIKYVAIFPHKLIVAIIILFFLHSHIRDVKDVEGDKLAGVKTVPVIFGDKWGVKVVGIMSSLAFILVPIFLGAYVVFATAIPATLVNYYFITKKPFVEKYIFYTYFIFVILSFLLLFLG